MHKRVGVVFSSFSAFALALNVLTPNNEDYWTNIIVLSSVAVIMAISSKLKRELAAPIQIAGLLVCAAVAPDSPGGPFFSMFLVVLSTVLYYAYDGYRSLVGVKLIVNAILIYVVMLLGLSGYPMPLYELPIRALGWSVMIYVFDFVLWIILDEQMKYYKTKIAELVKLNKEILETGECNDATREP